VHGGRNGNRNVAEIADCAQHLAAIAEQDPWLIHVLVPEVGKDVEVNAIFDGILSVLSRSSCFGQSAIF
jgi:hypothetical protein